MCFKIYAYEEVEKKGKLQRDSITNSSYSTNSSEISNNKNLFEISKILLLIF